jgi:hypothetical protein
MASGPTRPSDRAQERFNTADLTAGRSATIYVNDTGNDPLIEAAMEHAKATRHMAQRRKHLR